MLISFFFKWECFFQVMSYSSAMFEQVSVSKDTIPYIVVATGVINVACTVVAVSSNYMRLIIRLNEEYCTIYGLF